MWLQKLVRDFYKILNQVNSEAVPNDLKLPHTFSQLVSEMKSKKYNAKEFAMILKGMVSFMFQIHVYMYVPVSHVWYIVVVDLSGEEVYVI